MTRLDLVGIRLNQFEMFEEHKNCLSRWKQCFLDENNVEWEPCINRENKSLELTIKLYSCHDINIKFLLVVTPPSIYHGWSTRKMFWEEEFIGKQDFFESVCMKNYCRRKVRKHKEIKGSDKCHHEYWWYFEYLREVWLSEQYGNHIFRVKSRIGDIRKGVGNLSGSQDHSKVEKTQKRKVFHRKCHHEGPFQQNQRVKRNVKVPYVKRIPKREPTSSYFHLVVCLGDRGFTEIGYVPKSRVIFSL